MARQTQRIFGTDGIRDVANHGPLALARVLRLGEITAQYLATRQRRSGRIGLGWDTRISSPGLASALIAGLSSGGARVWRFGVMPTPAIAYLARCYQLDVGIAVSASHNPAADNGIKYFSGSGEKILPAAEQALERAWQKTQVKPLKLGTELGAIEDVAAAAAAAYVHSCLKRFAHAKLEGIKVVADLANGATCRTIPLVFQHLKIQTRYLANQPDGLNINLNCGSLHPEMMARQVRSQRVSAGMAWDGDGDRVILADEKGVILNGDRLLGLLAVHYARRGRLPRQAVVATVMSNLGLEKYLQEKKIRLLRVPVGDRHVAHLMQKLGLVLGGEQSGHLILPRYAPTGDGLITALEVLAVMQAEQEPLSRLAGTWQDFPQVLINVPVSRRPPFKSLSRVQQAVKAAERKLKDYGRVNLRYSGTEALARIMVEAENPQQVEHWANHIADAVEQALGTGQRRKIIWLTCA